MALHVVIPAHNEGSGIAATIGSVAAQSQRPDSITVLADNCSDDTAGLAARAGAQVFRTVGNMDKKAGALNQFLAECLGYMQPDDLVLVMDADTRLDLRFIEHARTLLTRDKSLGAVGGVFVGLPPQSWLEHCQNNEYARYARDVARHAGRVLVLTGTASVFRVQALQQVLVNRGTMLPGRRGQIYDVESLTEDNEMTLALKHLSWGMISPKECRVWTELMPTVGDLHRQRLRWYRGAIDNLRHYGLTRVTGRYWVQQGTLMLSVAILALLFLITTIGLALGSLRVSPIWSGIGLIFIAERVVSSWRTQNTRSRIISLLVFPEFCYDLILQVSFMRALLHSVRGNQATWHHLAPPKELAPCISNQH